MAAVFGVLARDHHLVAFADADLVVATGAAIRPFGLIGLDVTHVDALVGFGPAMRVHNAATVPKPRVPSVHGAATPPVVRGL